MPNTASIFHTHKNDKTLLNQDAELSHFPRRKPHSFTPDISNPDKESRKNDIPLKKDLPRAEKCVKHASPDGANRHQEVPDNLPKSLSHHASPSSSLVQDGGLSRR